ncbi:MAG TPA: hypothetical protein VND64_18810 [Pirellulales bacterium]|nr:hypothetical protein [Pirellulales bacterium]
MTLRRKEQQMNNLRRTSTPVCPRVRRRRLNLHGLLPPEVENLDQQVARADKAYRRKDDDLKRRIYLRALLRPPSFPYVQIFRCSLRRA